MEVDHFNPTLKQKIRNRYSNLMLACRHCNLIKSDVWPTIEEQAKGTRLLDCTREQDFGVHIFENASTGHLYGATPAGKFHIDALDLNHPFFKQRRRDRTGVKILTQAKILFRDQAFETMRAHVRTVSQLLENEIPVIPPWSGPTDPEDVPVEAF